MRPLLTVHLGFHLSKHHSPAELIIFITATATQSVVIWDWDNLRLVKDDLIQIPSYHRPHISLPLGMRSWCSCTGQCDGDKSPSAKCPCASCRASLGSVPTAPSSCVFHTPSQPPPHPRRPSTYWTSSPCRPCHLS